MGKYHMGLFDKIREPIILQEGTSLKNQLEQLEQLLEQAEGDLKERIQKEIFAVKAGIAGEEQIMYELTNSHMPMYVIHDWTIVHDEQKAQIDFLVVTRGKTFIIECKNLWGDITVDNKGQFVRKVNYGKYTSKEAMYSPIEQNRKHLELLKEITLSRKGMLGKLAVNKWFDTWYQGVVVMANPKMVINDRYAPKEIKQQLVRADGLVDYIRKINSQPEVEIQSEKDFTDFANKLLAMNVENNTDYTAKYREELQRQKEEANNNPHMNPAEPTCPRCGGKLIKRVARKGANAGNVFYGCEHFPKCRGIMSEEQYLKNKGEI